jgi:hypothetical protein
MGAEGERDVVKEACEIGTRSAGRRGRSEGWVKKGKERKGKDSGGRIE